MAAPFGLEPKYLDPESSVLPIRRQGKSNDKGSWYQSFARLKSRRTSGRQDKIEHHESPAKRAYREIPRSASGGG
jgi:hypothetical protein